VLFGFLFSQEERRNGQVVIDEKTEEGKKLLRIADLNEIAFTEVILSIDVSNSNGKIAFGIVKSCKSKEFEDGNAALA